MQMPTILWIALGGGLGTLLRYVLASWLSTTLKPGFPFGTLAVNLIGCFLIGCIYGYFDKQTQDPGNWKTVLTIGFCGGFTTFSAFAIENLQLLRDGSYQIALLYIFSSVLIGLLLAFVGWQLIRY